jgi:lupus La protein
MADEVKPVEAEATQVQAPESATEKAETTEQVAASKPSENTAEATNSEETNTDDKSEAPTAEAKDDSLKRKRNDEDRHSKPYQRQFKNYRENIKSKFDLPESSDPNEIREQVEFYFSLSNLIKDKYLYERTGGLENKPVPISILHGFKRMRHFQPFSAIVEALKESTILDVVNGDEVKRKTPLEIPEGMDQQQHLAWFENEASKRTLYAKGFNEENESTQLDIEDFFRPYGPINSVRLRRSSPENIFKRSVFVEFATPEGMEQFMALDPKPKWQDEKELLVMTKKQYCDGKIEDIKSGKVKPNQQSRGSRGGFTRGNNGRGRGGRGRGGDRRGGDRRDRSRSPRRDRRDRDGNDWKGRRDDFQKGGYKDRSDRNGRRDGFDRDRRNDEKKEPEVDSKYVNA